MQEGTKTQLEEPVSLSKSTIWGLQRRFFAREGADAWARGIVPSEVSTHPLLARAIADVVLGVVRDARRDGAWVADQPLYLAELGSGSGRLGVGIARELRAMRDVLGDAQVKLVLTDFTESVLDALSANPAVKACVDRGELDLALFDADRPGVLQLRFAQTALEPANPLVLLASYVFDSLRVDSFEVRDGQLLETRVAAEYVGEGPFDPDAAEVLENVELRPSPTPIELPHYDDAVLDPLLATYRDALGGSAVLLPVGALAVVRHFLALAPGGLTLLCGDRAYRSFEELRRTARSSFAAHGSLSITVNLHAVETLFDALGGATVHSPHADTGYTVSLFTTESAIPETRHAFERAFGGFSPRDCQALAAELGEADLDLRGLLRLIRLSHFNPYVFRRIARKLRAAAKDAAPRDRDDLAVLCQRVWEHHFPFRRDDRTAFHLGTVLADLGRQGAAVPFFRRALADQGNRRSTWFNLGLCYEELGERDVAAEAFEAVLALAPDFERAREKLNRIREAGAASPDAPPAPGGQG